MGMKKSRRCLMNTLKKIMGQIKVMKKKNSNQSLRDDDTGYSYSCSQWFLWLFMNTFKGGKDDGPCSSSPT
ncbi:hypothetical protein QJS10_CPA06g00220 [Acorus calamus]|uniref:Uncharacterized protein n=1 Tax=Acorus calamus TaxID=4465 RepID=A0AAV9EMT4_ACOCL|nr:hypothetical protein QJS10_CPA06g00220 [Acorus calamus]